MSSDRRVPTPATAAADAADAVRLRGLCACFFVQFFAYFGAQNQITSALGSFGSLSLGLLYGSLAVSAPSRA